MFGNGAYYDKFWALLLNLDTSEKKEMWLRWDPIQKRLNDKVLIIIFKFCKFKFYSFTGIYKAHTGTENTAVTKGERLLNEKEETQLNK